MTEHQNPTRSPAQEPAREPAHDPALRGFADQVAGEVQLFLEGLQTVAREADPGRAVSLLLLEVSQVLFTGAKLGAQRDFTPRQEYQPDVGPEADADDLRMRLAAILGEVDTYSFVFDPYDPEIVVSLLSDDLTTIATDLENGLRHHRQGNVDEALWWWQFSYVSSWGNLAGATVNALWSIVNHDRLDADVTADEDQVEAAREILG